MKARLDCIPCLQRQALEAVRFVTDDEILQEKILRRVMKTLDTMGWGANTSLIAQRVHAIVREETKVNDPYAEVKKKYNDIALSLYPELKEKVKQSKNPLLTATKLSIAGNIIDFGTPRKKFNLEKTIESVLEKDFAINHFDDFSRTLENADTMLYLVDNMGEIVFDRVLLETMQTLHPLKKIIVAVKGAPILNDAMEEDARYVGIDKIQNVELMDVGTGEAESGMERTSDEFFKFLKKMDMGVSKGQGNYEFLSEQPDIFFLLMVKCAIIGQDIGADVGGTVVKINRGRV
jgi:hypothetical protein